MSTPDFSLILTCYNEGPTLEDSVGKITSQLKKLKIKWELVFVEDKSTDNTKKNLEKIVKHLKNARVIFHNKNLGRGRSVADGIIASKAQICGYMDVDCEVSPSYIPLFIQEIKNGADLVVGKRFYEKGLKSLQRVVASRVYAQLIKWLLKVPVDDTEAGYKFFNRKNILKILPRVKSNGWFWDTEICAISHYEGLKISEIPVIFSRRQEKKSTVRLVSDSIDYIRQLGKFRSRKLKKRNE